MHFGYDRSSKPDLMALRPLPGRYIANALESPTSIIPKRINVLDRSAILERKSDVIEEMREKENNGEEKKEEKEENKEEEKDGEGGEKREEEKEPVNITYVLYTL